jgi:hypothetical protein
MVFIIIGLLVWALIRGYEYNRKTISSGPKEVLIVAQWFNQQIPPSQRGEVVAARKPHIAYYMGLDFKRIPYVNTYSELIEQLKSKEVDYLFFGIMEAGTRRAFQFLLDPSQPHPGLKPIVYTTRPPSVLYRVE